jgi:pilus assembly protein CpaE
MEQANNKPLNVLVIAKYDPAVDWMELFPQERNYNLVGRVESVGQALQQIERVQVDLVLADSSGEGASETGWIKQLAAENSQVIVLVIAASTEMDFVREAMLAGSSGFLLKPFDLPELYRSIEQVHELWLQRHARLAAEQAQSESALASSKRAHAVAVYSPKGGTGTTTLAVNLAIALKQQTDAPILLVDVDLRTADIDIFLSIFSRNSILDLMGLDQKIDRDMLARTTSEHASGITVLRGDSQLQFVESPFEPGQIGELIAELTSIWDGYIVINTDNGLDRWTIEILDNVDTVLVVTTPELPSLRATRNFLDLAEAATDQTGKWKVVMNAYQGQKVLRLSDIEASIHFPVMGTISEDSALVPASINGGKPLIVSHQKSLIAKDITALTKQLLNGTQDSSMSESADGMNPSSKPEASNQKGQARRVGFWNTLTNAVRPT